MAELVEGYPVVDLARPHGFLVWKGKQTSIGSPTPLCCGKVMITSDGEAFGVATLGQEVRLSVSEFDKQGEKHCVRIEERKVYWPTATSFYLYHIKEWDGYAEPQPIIPYEPTPLEADIIEKSKRLPKTIILHPEAITLEGEGYTAIDGLSLKEVGASIEAIFENYTLLEESNGEKALPLYQLALVRRPTLRFEEVKKKEVTPMPYEINEDECVINTESGEVEKCHDSHEEAEAHLAALNINVVAEEKSIEPVESKAGRRLASRWVDKLRAAKDALQELMGFAEYEDIAEEEEEVMLAMLNKDSGVSMKMVNGEPWHLSWSSNSFQDRDGEIFSLKSLEQYVRENEENEVKGYFNLWHIKNTDFAEKRYQAIIGKFLFEAGPYLKDAKGQQALKFFKEYSAGHPDIAPEGWGASVEYRYLPEERKSKIYEWTWITRTSTLARGAAANVWTKASQEEFKMNDEQRKAANAIFGEEFTNKLVSTGEQKTAELEDIGINNKAATPEGEQPVETPAKEAEVNLNQLVEELAAKMMGNISEALTPVLTQFNEQIVNLNTQVTVLGDELKQLKREESVKQQVELPRFTFNMLRASDAKNTVVSEGDALKNQKPLEVDAATQNGGSIAPSYFPTIKR